MDKMRFKSTAFDLLSILKRRFNEFLAIVGLIATFYFGFFYVPSYVEESALNKQRLMREELVREIGRQLYAGQRLVVQDIYNALHAKRAYYSLDAAPSPQQVLLLVQNDFERNEYVSTAEKARVRSEIRSVLAQLKQPAQQRPWWAKLSLLEILSALTAVLAAGFGVVSLLYQSRRQAELDVELVEVEAAMEEVRDEAGQSEPPRFSLLTRHLEYADTVKDALLEAGFAVESSAATSGVAPHFAAQFAGQAVHVETKAYLSKVGVATIQGFLSTARRYGAPCVLVTTSTLTVRARELLDKYRVAQDREGVFVIYGVTKAEIVHGLMRVAKSLSTGKW